MGRAHGWVSLAPPHAAHHCLARPHACPRSLQAARWRCCAASSARWCAPCAPTPSPSPTRLATPTTCSTPRWGAGTAMCTRWGGRCPVLLLSSAQCLLDISVMFAALSTDCPGCETYPGWSAVMTGWYCAGGARGMPANPSLNTVSLSLPAGPAISAGPAGQCQEQPAECHAGGPRLEAGAGAAAQPTGTQPTVRGACRAHPPSPRRGCKRKATGRATVPSAGADGAQRAWRAVACFLT